MALGDILLTILDLIKQGIDSLSDRIRSPILGSVSFAILVVNWKAFYFLFFAKVSVEAKILYFDEHTNLNSLLYYPIFIGIALALFKPWLTFGGAFAAKFPNFYLYRLQQTEGTRRKIEELRIATEFEQEKAYNEAAVEERKIAAARRLEDASEVSEELKEEIKTERRTQGEPIVPVKLRESNVNSVVSRSVLNVLANSQKELDLEDIVRGVTQDLSSLEGSIGELPSMRITAVVRQSLVDLRSMDIVKAEVYGAADDEFYSSLTAHGYAIQDGLADYRMDV